MSAAMMRDRARFLDARLSFLSRAERDALRREYERREAKTSHRSANIWLRKLTERALAALRESAFYKPLTGDRAALYGDRELKQLAEAHAREVQLRIGDFAERAGECYEANINALYGALSVYVERHAIAAPYKAVKNPETEMLESAVLRMSCGDWWHRKLSRQRAELLEYVQVALGRVRRNVSAYISKKGLAAHRRQVRAGVEFLQVMEALSEDGETVPLSKLADASSSNPEKRRIELMVRCRGLEDLANEMGYQGLFLTITTPSKYHATSRKWAGTTPRDAQECLNRSWRLIRAQLAKQDIDYFGVRVAEPHHDATPHWHLLLFVKPHQAKPLVQICRRYAMREDADEAGADKNRFDCVYIDPNKGSATGYIAKYISKNINAERMTGAENIDEEAQTTATEGAERVRGWASTWRVRQFQFFGAASVSVWRELRRLKTPAENERLEQMRGAADAAKWAEFQRLVKETPVKLARVDDGVTTYNEPKSRIVGVALKSGPQVATRVKRWLLRKRGDSRATWSTVINCNQREHDNDRSAEKRSESPTYGASQFNNPSKNGPSNGIEADLGGLIRSAAKAIYTLSGRGRLTA